MTEPWDAVVVGSGPNGVAAAIEIARAGHSVLVIEADARAGGALRTEELTLPGFRHDRCAAIHPMAVLSPFFRDAELEASGLEWCPFPVGVAHPLDDRPAAILTRDATRDAERLGADAAPYSRMLEPFLHRPEPLFEALLGPPGVPRRGALRLARFGALALRSATAVAETRLRTEAGRALFAGCAGHSILPLGAAGTAAFGLVFSLAARLIDWPCARGGSGVIAVALRRRLLADGGTIETDRPIRSIRDLPPSRVVLFDLAPRAIANIARAQLPHRYVERLLRYRYGPGVFKLDWALDGPIPWRDPVVGEASTVHVGGTLEEIARAEHDAWHGTTPERPFLILCQQSVADPTRAPAGQHTGYAYCHVPAGGTDDLTAPIEQQVERFAPGFRDRILARHATTPTGLERLNPNCVGGAITGGAATLRQLLARPTWRWRPYTTPNPRIFICSASTPPGGGVHGMCGFHAARAALRQLRRPDPGAAHAAGPRARETRHTFTTAS